MFKKIKVSVIIPVYNTEKYLRECVDSILNQTLKEVEIIIVDDGSTDGSRDIINEFAQKYSCIKTIHCENNKQGAARNKGMELAVGEYIYFLDSDDYLAPDALKILYDMAIVNKLEVITFDADIIGLDTDTNSHNSYDRSKMSIESTKVWEGFKFWNKYYNIGGALINVCLMFYSHDFLVCNHFLFQSGVYYEDSEFGLKSYLSAKRLMYLPKQLYFRRCHNQSTMMKKYDIYHLLGCFAMVKMIWRHLIEYQYVFEDKYSTRRFLSMAIERTVCVWDQLRDIEFNRFEEPLLELVQILGCTEKEIAAVNLDIDLANNLFKLFKKILSYSTNICYIDKLSIQLHEWQKNEINCIFRFLKQKNGFICIYGTGRVAEDFIGMLYGLRLEELGNKIIFAQTVNSISTYMEQKLIAVDEIGKYEVSGIIVGSLKFEAEMLDIIRNLYGEKYKVLTYKEILNRKYII